MATRAEKNDDWRDQRGTVLHTLQNKKGVAQGVNMWKQREQEVQARRGGAPRGGRGQPRGGARSAKRASKEVVALDLSSYAAPKTPSFGKLRPQNAESSKPKISRSPAHSSASKPAPAVSTPTPTPVVKAAPTAKATPAVTSTPTPKVAVKPTAAVETPAPTVAITPAPVVEVTPAPRKATPVAKAEVASSSLKPTHGREAMKKRHSKIDMGGSVSLGTAALDVEGLGGSAHRKAETVTVPAKKGGLGNMWAQKMAQKQEDSFQANRDKLRNRRKGGVQFMDTQIRNLIKELKKHPGGGGLGFSVNFGTLFKTTIDSMPALSATLQCAKKRGVVQFEGCMLMQGVSDNVVITLIKDEIEDTPDFQSVVGIRPIRVEQSAPAMAAPSSCHTCNKTVYPLERVAANGKVMHKGCFRCCVCQTVLKLAAYAFNGGKFYCETHFQQQFKQNTSYNF